MYNILYGVGFFLMTILIQYLLYKFNINKGNVKIWTGSNAVLVICMLGLFQMNICYLAAVIGFIAADEIGKIAGWN